MTKPSHFKYFKTSPEIIRLAVMLYFRFPLSLRNVEDLLHERGVEVSHETVRFWWHRFGPMFAAEVRKRRVEGMKSSRWRWHLDEMFVTINGERHYFWRAVDHEGEVLESFVTEVRDEMAELRFLMRAMRRHGRPEDIATNRVAPSMRILQRLAAVHSLVSYRVNQDRSPSGRSILKQTRAAALAEWRGPALNKGSSLALAETVSDQFGGP